MIKVVFVTTDLELGGAEMMLLRLLSRIDRRKFEPTVISLGGSDELAEQIKVLGVVVHDIGIRTGAGIAVGTMRLCRYLHEIKPDIIQGWMVHGNLVAALGGVVTRIPVFWGVRHSRLDMLVERRSTVLLERLLALLSRIPRRIIYNSQSGRIRHESLGYVSSRGIVVPNGFDLDRFKPDEVFRYEVRRELGIDPSCVVVGLFARFHPMKDHATLLDAVKMLRPNIPQLKVILAGEGCGAGNPELSKMIADRDLTDVVLLLGPRGDLERLTAAIDVAANSSRAVEGFSNVIGEAMAAGVPCVVTDVGDAALIVADNGEIVPPSDARAFSEALRRMILLGSDGRREMGAKARKRIVESFSIDTVTREYEILYGGDVVDESRVHS